MPCNYKDYPADWKAIRAEVMERAGNCCEGTPEFPGCRVRHGGIYMKDLTGERVEHDGSHADDQYCEDFNVKCTKVVLTIAHMDHDKTNNGEPGHRPNLRALCQRCHLAWDLKHHVRNARATRERKMGLIKLDL